MKKKRFSDEQIVTILQEAEKSDQSLAEVCRQKGISEQTFYRWRKRFQGLQVTDVKRLRELSAENAKLKRLLAERDLEIDSLKELVQKKW